MARTDVPIALSRPRYSFAEADRLAHASRGTARRWLAGYTYRGAAGEKASMPPVTPGTGEHGGVSFLDLIEVAAISRLRESGFSLAKVREIVAACRTRFHVARPLSELRFKVDGRDAFVEHDGVLHDVLRHRGASAWDEILGPFLETLDYEDHLAARWWPMGREHRVVIDPAYGFGLPVVSGSGVRTEIVRERFEAGDSHAQIAEDFNLTPAAIDDALRFELRLSRAA